jgi:predicted regulator of Ras-like GTPase activity (Roadblock/LC7/MglB family)
MPPLSDALNALAARPDVVAAIVVSDEGLVIAVAGRDPGDAETVAAFTATAQRAQEQLTRALGQRPAAEAVLAGPDGSTVLQRLSTGATLLVIAAASADLGEVLYAIRCGMPALSDAY